MKFKRLMLVTFVLLAILTLGAVSATDDVAVDDFAVDDGGDSIESPVNEDGSLSDGEDPEYYIGVTEDNIITDTTDEAYSEDNFVACVILPNDTTNGRFAVFDGDNEIFGSDVNEEGGDWHNPDESPQYLKCNMYLKNFNFDVIDSGTVLKFIFMDENGDSAIVEPVEMRIHKEDTYISFSEPNNQEDEGGDADDGVIIWVATGNENQFELNNNDTLEAIIASISVSNNLQGNIIIRHEDEEEDVIFFNRTLSEITNSESDGDNEGFTVYRIAIGELNIDDFKTIGTFKIGFYNEETEIDSRSYDIEYEDEYNIMKLWEQEDNGEDDDKGEYLESITFVSGNAVTNDVIIYIPKDSLPEDIDDEFDVIITDDDFSHKFKITELNGTDENYVLKVLDLFEFDRIGESSGFNIIVQFYRDEQKAYYSHPEDDEFGIEVYTSPFISDESYLFEDRWVISFRGFIDVDDEFNVTISQDGAEDIVKTFKISELDNLDEEDGEFYELHLSDLGITEPGEYTIAVKFTNGGEDLAYNSGNVNVSKVLIRAHGPDDDEDPVIHDVSSTIFHIGASENVTGFVKIFVGDNQVGENISFADLQFDDWPSHYGRQIYLNNFKITESGNYTLKVEVYDENGNFLGDCVNEVQVEVRENNVKFYSGSYGSEGNIEFSISTPLLDGQYYNIYLNGEKAGYYTVEDDVVISDEFTDTFFEISIFKPGNYDVNVTFFDGENETDFKTGSFSINSLNITSDKEIYVYGVGDVLISFKLDEILEGYRLNAYYLYYWDRVQADESMIFNPYGANSIREELYDNGTVTFSVARFMAEPENPSYRLDLGINYIRVTYKPSNEEDGGITFGDIIAINVVEHLTPNLTINPISDVEDGSDVLVVVNADEAFFGAVSVLVGDEVVATINIVDGEGSVTVGAEYFSVGVNTVKVTSEASELFAAGEASINITVNANNANSILTANDTTAGYLSGAKVVATIKDAYGNPISGVEIIAVINGASETLFSDANGDVYLNIGKLTPGNYTATFTFAGNDHYMESNATATVEIVKEDTIITLVYDADAKELVATLTTIEGLGLSSTTININVAGADYAVKTNNKGVAKLSTADLKPGIYNATATFNGNSKFKATNATTSVNTKIDTAITLVYDELAKELVATLNIVEGGALSSTTVNINVDGVDYAVKTNSRGVAKLSVADLTVGNHVATASYNGNYKYDSAEATINMKVKTETAITLVYDELAKELVATLGIAEGGALSSTTVNINVNGVDYAVKTNNRGVAKVSVADLVAGNYVATASYSGNYRFSAAEASINMKVKTPTVLSAVYDANAKELAVTLTTAEGGPLSSTTVNINIDGVGYAVKTNNRGVAVLSTADIAPGSYTASISYGGNGRFSSGSTTIDIEV